MEEESGFDTLEDVGHPGMMGVICETAKRLAKRQVSDDCTESVIVRMSWGNISRLPSKVVRLNLLGHFYISLSYNQFQKLLAISPSLVALDDGLAANGR